MIYYLSINTPLIPNEEFVRLSNLSPVIDYLKDKPIIGLDCETTGLDTHSDRIIMLQIGDLTNQYVIDTRGLSIEPLRSILEDPAKTFVGQNIKYDYNMLKARSIVLPNVYDTMVMDQVIHNGKYSQTYIIKNRRFSLKEIYRFYYKKEIDKEIRNEFTTWGNAPFTKDQIMYSAKDIIYPLEIKAAQDGLINEYALTKACNLENKALLALADIEYNGMTIDPVKWHQITLKTKDKLKDTVSNLDSILIDKNPNYKLGATQLDLFTGKPSSTRLTKINWSSDQQVIAILNNDFDIAPMEKGKLTSSTDALRMLPIDQANMPIVKTLIQYRKETKIISSFGQKYLDKYLKKGNKLHTTYNSVVATGRISSRNPNLQQIPNTKEFRECFISSTGDYEVTAADYQAQEQRIIASKSKDQDYLNFFNEDGSDIHSFVASKLFSAAKGEYVEVINDENHENYKLRQQGKILGFMISFGGSEFTLAKRLKIPTTEAKELIDAFFKGFPTLLPMFNKNADFALKHGFIRVNSVTNRLRWLPMWEQYNKLSKIPKKALTHVQRTEMMKLEGVIRRRALNTPIQGTAGDITKTALILYRDFLIANNIRPLDNAAIKLIGQVHDELLIESRKNLTEVAVKTLEQCMEEAGGIFCKGLTMKATAKTGTHWIH